MLVWVHEAGPSVSLSLIPDGVAGIDATLDRMVALVRQYRKNGTVRELATELTKPLQGKDFAGEARKLWDFVRTYIRFVRDIRDVETLQTPLVTLGSRAGDCDDHSILLASLLQAIGHPVRCVAMRFGPEWDDGHVLVETLIGERWVPAETTLAVPFGWSPPGQTERIEKYP